MDYHNHRFDDHSLMIFKDKDLIALFPANISGHNLISHQGLTYGGLILHDSIRFEDVLSVFKSLLYYLFDKGITDLTLKLLPKIYHASPSDEIDYLLFKCNAELIRRDVLSVLKPKEKHYSRDRKAGIKRGLHNNLRVEETDTFDAFWNEILIPNLDSKFKTSPVHNLEEITRLKLKFPDQIRQFNVYKNEKIVAGTTIFDTKFVAHSQYISGNAEKNKLGSLDFLHAHLLEHVFGDKPYFDFGISNENEGKNFNQGLLYWKEGFGARAISHDFYKLDTKNYNELDNVML